MKNPVGKSIAEIDRTLQTAQREREEATAQLQGWEKAARLAHLYDLEAGLWEQLTEQSKSRLLWRAALAARIEARRCATVWRRRAQILAAGSPPAPTALDSQAEGRVA